MSSAASTSSAAFLASSPASVYRLWVLLPLPWWLGARPLPDHGLNERVGRFVFILAETRAFLRHGGKLRVGRVGSTGLLAFGHRCDEMGVRPSRGSVGNAYDNAMAESFFATLECELLARRRFRTQADARVAVFRYIEGWYNPHRRHSALGQRSPISYERATSPAA